MGNGPFTFSGLIHATTSQRDAISLAFGNGVIAADFTGTADVSIYTPQLTASLASTTPCSISVVSQQVKPGALWASFSCPRIAAPPSSSCGLEGVVVFENCSGS